MRAKRILGLKNINIYALGIYVDDVAAKRQLGARLKSSSEDAVAQDQKLFDGRVQREVPLVGWVPAAYCHGGGVNVGLLRSACISYHGGVLCGEFGLPVSYR